MKTTIARLDWREGRRRRAWELKEAGLETDKTIAAALGVTSGAVSQWLTRARSEGVEEGLRRASRAWPYAEAHARATGPAAGAPGPWSGGVWLSGPGLDV